MGPCCAPMWSLMSCGPSLRVFFRRTRGGRAGRGITIGRLWRALPGGSGPGRHGVTYRRMFAKVRDEAAGEQRELLGLISVDSTSVRAHQHAAGARPTLATGGWME